MPADTDALLWDVRRPCPAVDDIPLLDHVTHIMVQRSRKGQYQWLYDPAVARHHEKLYVSWTNCWKHELDPGGTIRFRWTEDRGVSWGDVASISPEADASYRYIVDTSNEEDMVNARDAFSREKQDDVRGLHGRGPDRYFRSSFLGTGDALWALVSCYGVGKAGGKFPGLRMVAYVLDQEGDCWREMGVVADNFMPTSQPQRMENGNWIVGGQNHEVAPAVAISRADDFAHWEIVRIPCKKPDLCPIETTLIADGAEITAIMRKQGRTGPRVALTSVARDFGVTWTEIVESNYPMAQAQPFAGKLSTGQRYLISNYPMPGTTTNDLTVEGFKGRDILTIAVSNPLQKHFSGIWKIRNERSPRARMAGDKKTPQFSAPYAVEANGYLYVVYGVAKEDCALSIIPITCFNEME